ncbi:MAG: putative transporter [Elusimicrobiales bacterium]
MELINSIFLNPIFSTLFAIAACGVIGLYIGSIKLFKINIGITGVLFAGIVLSYLGIKFDENLIHFIREFGLVLFVYAVGMQVGGGFFSAFKKNGLRFNIFALTVIALNLIIVLLIKYLANIDPSLITGLYCGAVTNTPALASAQATASSLGKNFILDNISSSYAIAYPGAIFSLVISMIILKTVFKNDYEEDMNKTVVSDKPKILNVTVSVENKNINNIKIKDIPAIDDLKIVVTRVKRGGDVFLAHPDTEIKLNDLILAVGEEKNIEEFIKIVGSKSDVDLKSQSQKIIHTRAVVTNKSIIGKKIYETKIPSYGVIITRASRADVEFIVSDDYTIQFGDNIVIVGDEDNVKKAVNFIGNSPKDLNHPELVPIFIGMIVGIIIGIIPIHLPFVNGTLKLGLAGGQLISAIIFANLGNIGRISWYIPPASNLMLRELGIIMFLAAVGLKSGHSFFDTIINGNGLVLVFYGLLVSFIPVFIVGYVLKKIYKIHYLTICGLLSGSMTDPPALAFANSISDSNLPSISYATVYPLTMFLRIISAQILILFFYG